MVRIHLDTDIGGNIDDLCALAYAMANPDIELVAVTTNCENDGKRAGYARYALDLGGHSHVAVAAGADNSLGLFRCFCGLPVEELFWPEPVDALPGVIDRALGQLQASIEFGALIVTVGAFTNLALLEKRSPGILAKAQVVSMGGFLFPPRPGFPAWDYQRDWNVQVDAASAVAVFQATPVLMVPISITVETFLRVSQLATLSAGGPISRLIARQTKAFATIDDRASQHAHLTGIPEDVINFQHDPLTIAIAAGFPATIRDVRLRCEIQDGWLVQHDDPNGVPARIVTSIDGQAFDDHWLEQVRSI